MELLVGISHVRISSGIKASDKLATSQNTNLLMSPRQVQSYVQVLWQHIDVNKENVYNGAAEGIYHQTICVVPSKHRHNISFQVF